ncbi:unnamed protein product [Ilex paraguariensis]|uniref:Ultraviolet-B receptor UVR8 n=1 Tax=Ilex paraguariensis TaxID=185542 RepID=A0ABC8TER6_9AQUA
MVAAGAEHTAAVTEDGELYGWGWGRYGNLGLGDRNDRLFPEKVSIVNGPVSKVLAQQATLIFWFEIFELYLVSSMQQTAA